MQFSISQKWLDRFSNDSNKPRARDSRSPFQRDKARVLHSAAFRRLQSKTQIHNNGLSDFYRTRLTHSLEVAQIGVGIVSHLQRLQPEFKSLLPDESLIETICLSHDIGHPPFGHGGEIALNYMMRESGGFEGNGQTFRILTQLESYTQYHGMNLTLRSLLGLLKYPATLNALTITLPSEREQNFRQLDTHKWIPAKGIYEHDISHLAKVFSPLSDRDKIKFQNTVPSKNSHSAHRKTQFKSIDCSIMEIADDIAYGVHDLEDAIAMGLVSKSLWKKEVESKLYLIDDFPLKESLQTVTEGLFSEHQYQRKDAIGTIVNALITSSSIKKIDGFDEPLLSYNATLAPALYQALKILKSFVLNYVIKSPNLQIVEYRGQQIVMELFEAFNTGPLRFLPETAKRQYRQYEGDPTRQQRVIADYISSFTDNHALRLHANLFSSNQTTPMIGLHSF
jgi:dGTPase